MPLPFKRHGITKQTIKKLLLNAAVVYKNLKYDKQTSKWTGTPIGATSGGVKFHWEATYLDIEIDGATVLVKGVSKQKTGENASIEAQMTEISEGILKDSLHLVAVESEDPDYVCYTSPENITEDDYLDNIALVGTLSGGEQVVIILPNAICLEALELDTQNNNQTTYAVKFEATADLESDNLNKLDVKIYYPKPAAA